MKKMEILELKNSISEIKIPLDKLNSRMEMKEGRVRDLKTGQWKLFSLRNREGKWLNLKRTEPQGSVEP